MVADPYRESGYEPARPEGYTGVLSAADYRSPEGMGAAPYGGLESELARQEAEFLERQGFDYRPPEAGTASPGETASLDEMVTRVYAEDSGAYREPDNSYGWIWPDSRYGPAPSAKPEDGWRRHVREYLKKKCAGGKYDTQERYTDEKPEVCILRLSSTDNDHPKDTKEETPYRDADVDYDDNEGTKPYDLGIVGEGKGRRGESWADTALSAAKFMAIFTAGTLIAFTVYSGLGLMPEFPLFVTGSPSMEIVAPSDGSCEM